MSVRDELRSLNEAFSAAVAGNDLDALVAFHTDDARVLPPAAPAVEGLAQIRAFTLGGLAEGPQTIDFETGQVLEDGRLVVDVGTYVKRVARDGGPPVEDRGKYVAVYERQGDGALKLAVDMFSSDLPGPVAPAGPGPA
jgi:ketosteroid isomerase-like protein